MSDSLVQRLCDFWQEKFPEEAIKKAVRSAFPNLCKNGFPVSPKMLAYERGVISIRAADIKADGIISIVEGSGKYSIKLNKNHSDNRQRFTIAHEIGHTFFFDLEPEISTRARILIEDNDLSNTNKQEEYLCNVAAAEILMPSKVFSERIRLSGPSSKTIINLSRLFKTSLWATSRRLVELCPFPKLVVALWEYQPDVECYQTSWIVRTSRNRSPKTLIVDRRAPIFRTFQSMASFRGRRLISLGNNVDDYFVDGCLLGGSDARKVLTVFVLDHRANNLFNNDNEHASDTEQMVLFS